MTAPLSPIAVALWTLTYGTPQKPILSRAIIELTALIAFQFRFDKSNSARDVARAGICISRYRRISKA